MTFAILGFVWFLIGTLVARWSFILYLGDSPRYGKYFVQQEYGGRSIEEYTTSPAFDRAQVHAFWSVPLWPFYIVAAFIGMKTPHEKHIEKMERLKELESEMERLEDEYGLKFTLDKGEKVAK